MKLITQGSSVTVRVRLKDGQKWIDFERVENLSVTLFNSNMNRRTPLASGSEYTVHGDMLTLLLDKRLTERIGKYRALLSFDQSGHTLAFDPFLFAVARSSVPSTYIEGQGTEKAEIEYEVVFGQGSDNESDPIFQNSPAGAIKQEDVDTWNTPPRFLSNADIDNICV